MRHSNKMIGLGFAVLAVFLFCGAHTVLAGDHALVGVKKCKTCHKKEKDGNQYGVWLESRHAKAYETLAGEKALEIAKGKGIENPQTAAECLECHATALPVMDDLANQKITLEEGVSCESCHGAGGDYYKKKVMTAIAAGEQDGAELGLLEVNEETCKGCHNENSPTFKEFNYEEMLEKIAHPRPDVAEAAE